MWRIDTPLNGETLKCDCKLPESSFAVKQVPCRHIVLKTENATMFFSQDPMLLYPQSPYMQSPAIPRSPPTRPSFLIDDLLVRRQSSYLVPKQPQDHGHDPQVPASSGNTFNFGMPSIFSRNRKEHSSVYQGIYLTASSSFTTGRD